MKKRILSLMLASALLFSMAAPAAAAEADSADRLAAVTATVKNTLNLDTELYTQFSGQLTEGELAPTWRLSWSGDGVSLEVEASESGRILSYYAYDEDNSWDAGPLTLPKGDPAKAKQAAAAFLKRVLDDSETADLDAASGQNNSLRQTRYYFRGTLLLNGQPSPLNYSVSVRASDCSVTSFYRDSLESGYIGQVPAPDFQMDQSAVSPLLKDTLSLRLEYVLDKDQTKAVLRYLPNAADSFYVDDGSKKLVNQTELYNELSEGKNTSAEEMAAEAPMADAGGADRNDGLTQAEQLGADKLKGALSKEALDQKAKAVTQLGLSGYTLASASYQEQEKDGGSIITARLTYAKQVKEDIQHRWVTLNAKTGELLGVYSSGRWNEDEAPKVDEAAARKTAEAFLTAQQGQRFAQCAAYTGDPCYQAENGRGGVWSFRYARKANGYFFPDDQFTVEIDGSDGAIHSYSQSWTQNVAFDSAQGLITAQQAVSAYFETFQVVKGYVAVPQKLDLSDPKFTPLAEMGYRALNSLKLGWTLKAAEKHASGIDAKTGKPVYQSSTSSDGTLKYSDLAGSWAKTAAETLADYGIGYKGGKLSPTKQLTQLDLVILLASTQGLLLDPANLAEGDADQAYRNVYSMGALQRADRNDSKVLSRIDVVKILLDAGGFGPTAKLQGIYQTKFADADSIPSGMLGYAALAQGLNVVRGDSGGKLNPTQPATRADAIVMLLGFMQRG